MYVSIKHFCSSCSYLFCQSNCNGVITDQQLFHAAYLFCYATVFSSPLFAEDPLHRPPPLLGLGLCPRLGPRVAGAKLVGERGGALGRSLTVVRSLAAPVHRVQAGLATLLKIAALGLHN